MKTKKIYSAPAMSAVELQALTLLAGSGELGVSGSIGGRGNIEDPEDDDE